MNNFFTIVILSFMTSVSFGADQVKVLIIDGVNNHDWESTTRATKATLEQTGRFKVDVSTSPLKRAYREEWEAWCPKFSDYQVVVSNFNDDWEQGAPTLWSEEMKADFEKFVREGGGFVPVHAEDNSSADWKEYNEMIGIGGWGGRKAGKSGYLLRMIDSKWQHCIAGWKVQGQEVYDTEISLKAYH